ncbi:hypothetical protein IJ818_03370 [bacterium]|nr:hypothetical protein [bacterium]
MKNKIITALMLFVLGLSIGNGIVSNSVMAQNGSSKSAVVENTQTTVVNSQLTQKAETVMSVKPLDLVENPDVYLNKKIKITALFDKFSILGLDYKPALRSSEKYITFLIQRPEVSNDIPLSELKNFLTRDMAEKFIDLNNGDTIEYTGTVFSTALGDVWVDVDSLTVLKKKETKK